MSPLTLRLYRYSFWLAPTTALSFWHGTSVALQDPARPWMTWWALIITYVAVPLIDLLAGRVPTHFTREQQAVLAADRMLRAIPWLCAASWFATLAWAIHVWPRVQALPWPHVAGFVVSLGVVGGILAINVGHELIHRRHPLERFLGGALLATVCYGVFKVEHVRGHHLRVATTDDPATARFGESAYRFVPRSIIGTLRHGWALERDRLARSGTHGLQRLLANEVAHWLLASLALTMIVLAWRGASGVALFAATALIAVVELELVNYIEHYGLLRSRDASGAPMPVAPAHSWDYAGWLTNALLINLQRHSDHHAHGGRPFAALNSHADAPQLPASYAAMILAALVPPLFRRIMDKRIPAATRGAN
ncbi:MAG: alkane 1-monooxygenase [Burkholderiales bacterium]|nr:alkane 1-monooxygenase [Burkholderiales bacterium]